MEPRKENTCAVVVTYHPDPGFARRLEAVADQVDRVLIVDNASSPEQVSMLEELTSGSNIETVFNNDNLGVATALNQGMIWAKERGYEWALTLDQDSTVYDGAIEKLAAVYRSCGEAMNIAVIGSNYYDSRRNEVFKAEPVFGGKLWTEVVTVITSGSLMFLRACDEIGPFRDEFFIDHVDDEYCLRARRKGFHVVLTRDPLVEHTISSPRRVKFLGRNLTTPDFPAFRRYYMARNHVVLIKEYRRTEPEWIRWSIRVRLKELELMLVLEKGKLHKMRKFLRGLFDGLTGKMGPLQLTSPVS